MVWWLILSIACCVNIFAEQTLFRKVIDGGTEHLIVDFTLREEGPFSQNPEWINVSYSNGSDPVLIHKAKLIYDSEGDVHLESIYKQPCLLSQQFIHYVQLGNYQFKSVQYDIIQQRWVESNSGIPLDHANLFYESQTSGGWGTKLLGLGEIILGGAIMITGTAVEIASFGTLTFGVVIAESSGAALIGHGIGLTIREAGPYVISKNDPGTPDNREVQDKQFRDAVKKLEEIFGKKLSDDEKKKLHHHVSGQNYGYHEIVTEGYHLLGGS